jgi:hydroxyacyl-ACP dehydratase HTD2-like protein with hotdog domain
VKWCPTTIQLFRFSAVTWNSHRIHFDQAYARTEGYPDTLVQSQLHGCFLAHTVLQWGGPGATLLTFRWENRHVAVAGDVLTCAGEVTAIEGRVVTCELQETNQDGRVCAPAWATVQLPPNH